ncbi:MAG: hypothetical protein Q4C64_04975 [Erysipelotrichia bacterium]|nr:hypothetical protein [Erysipelotrichia bacterium]
MKKKVTIIILSIEILLLSTAMYIYYNGKNIAPKTFKTSFIEIKSEKIPQNFNNFKILYFSDLEYGRYFNSDNLSELQKSIETLDYDMILFGGDLIDKDYSPISDDVDILKKFFSSLKSPYGNFAIFGDYDQSTESRNILVRMILEDSGFELIEKELIIYKDKQSIVLNGLNYNAEPLINPVTSFNITLIHNHNHYKSISSNADLILCGHTHSKQINLFSSADYKFGLQNNLYITRGVGLTGKDYRIFSYPEICLFTLNQ